MDKNWATIVATRTVNSTGFLESPIASITALLHQVVAECEAAARAAKAPSPEGSLALSAGAHTAANAIRAHFPRCPDAE